MTSSPEQARTIADGINRAELTVFENSGHFPFAEQQEEFLCVLRTWICQSR
jgi:pimeloyl-ACP methyl ester carboxylesterase